MLLTNLVITGASPYTGFTELVPFQWVHRQDSCEPLQNLCCKKKKFWQGIISMCFVEQASGLVLKQTVKQFLKGHGLVLCTYLVLSSDKLRPRNSLVKFRSCPSLNHCIEGAGTPLALQSITWYEWPIFVSTTLSVKVFLVNTGFSRAAWRIEKKDFQNVVHL